MEYPEMLACPHMQLHAFGSPFNQQESQPTPLPRLASLIGPQTMTTARFDVSTWTERILCYGPNLKLVIVAWYALSATPRLLDMREYLELPGRYLQMSAP